MRYSMLDNRCTLYIFLGFRSSDVEHLRIMTNDLITVNDDITLLLVFPPSDQMCVISDPEKYGHLAESNTLF